MRLQKYLASCGVASRRHAEQIILEGRVAVNGAVVRVLGTQVADGDSVTLDGRPVAPEAAKRVIVYHKPMGEVSTASDPEGRATVLDRFANVPERLYPVGRLDFDSEGLLLLTNDGEMTHELLHPSRRVEKVYLASVEGGLTHAALDTLRKGVRLSDGMTAPAKITVLGYDARAAQVRVGLHEGRNRQVRRMFEAVGCRVTRLKRVQFGPVRLGDLPRGQWRDATAEELALLRR